MALTPIDVQQKTFGTALRGYDLDEVDDFLDEVVTTLASYEQRLREAQERIAALESEVAEKGDAERAISRALLAAQRSADEIVTEARQEAERILAEAQTQADELAARRDRERDAAAAEIARLREVIDGLRSRVRELAESMVEDLDAMEAAAEEALAEVGVDEPTASEGAETVPETVPEVTGAIDEDGTEETADSQPEVAEVWSAGPTGGEEPEDVTDTEDTGEEEATVAEAEARPARRPWERD